MFPAQRLRRLRKTPALRNLFRETQISLHDLIYPIFIQEELADVTPLQLMPGINRYPEHKFVDEIKAARALGINSFILFGVSTHKDPVGSDAFSENGLVYRMVARAKDACSDANIISDLCFCEYTSHGHCGVLDDHGYVNNDATTENLGKQAVVAAKAGADVIAPSGMMDGQIRAIRQALDGAGFETVPIISYSTKFASSFYGPFREASGVTLKGDRKTYQADAGNLRQALLESALDEAEGADALMVKPGLAYLDVLARLKERTLLPVGMYQVGGEYAMIKFAAAAGAIHEETAIKETLTGIKRAGADFILTYFAKQAAQYVHDGWTL
jgi:porphobilinogen synthase